MTRSATEVMQEVVFAAVIDAIIALKASSRGLPNNLLRDLNAIHANTTLADLPKEVQDSIAANVRAAFTRLLKEGYSVSTGQPPRPPRPPSPGAGPRHRDQRRPPRREGDDPRRGPRGGRPQGGKPKPGG